MPTVRLDGIELAACPQDAAADADCAVIVTDRAAFDYRALVERSRLVVDTHNALSGILPDKIVRL